MDLPALNLTINLHTITAAEPSLYPVMQHVVHAFESYAQDQDLQKWWESMRDLDYDQLFRELTLSSIASPVAIYPVENCVKNCFQATTNLDMYAPDFPTKLLQFTTAELSSSPVLQDVVHALEPYAQDQDLQQWGKFLLEGHVDILAVLVLCQVTSTKCVLKFGDTYVVTQPVGHQHTLTCEVQTTAWGGLHMELLDPSTVASITASPWSTLPGDLAFKHIAGDHA
jgi:hypothetical protein